MAILSPLATYFIVTAWTCYAINRKVSVKRAARIGLGVIVSLLTVPAALILTVMTCGTAVESAGVGANIYGRNNSEGMESLIAASITFVSVGAVGFGLFFVLSMFQGSPEETSEAKKTVKSGKLN